MPISTVIPPDILDHITETNVYDNNYDIASFAIDIEDELSEVSYDGPLDNRNFAWTTLRLIHSLQLLFVFTCCFLTLYIMETYEYFFCEYYSSKTPARECAHLLLGYVAVLLNIIHLIFRIVYRRKVKRTVFPAYCICKLKSHQSITLRNVLILLLFICIDARLVVEITGIIGVIIISSEESIFHQLITFLRCYHIFFFYTRATTSNNRFHLIVLLQKYFLIYAFLIHTAACALQASCVGCNRYYYDDDTYMKLNVAQRIRNETLDLFHNGVSNEQFLAPWQWYWITMHYCIGSITFNGGNSAVNKIERIAHIVTIIITAYINLRFICDLALLRYYYFMDQVHYRIRVAIIANKLFEYDKVLSQEVTNYFMIYWEKESSLRLRDNLHLIPETMQSDLMLDVYWFALVQTQLFQSEGTFFRRIVSSVMYTESFIPGDIVYSTGVFLHNVYFVASGMVVILSDEDNEADVIRLGVGACFGDVSLVCGAKSRLSVVAHDYTRLHVLNKTDFWRLENIKLAQSKSLHVQVKDRLLAARLKQSDALSAKKTHAELMDHLPKERSRDIYDPRKGYEKTTFCQAYSSYVLSDVRKAETSEEFFFRTVFPWKLQPATTFFQIWDIIVVFTILIGITYLPYFWFVLREYRSKEFSLLMTYVAVVFILDLILSCCTIVDRIQLVTSTWHIFLANITRKYFLIDLLGAVYMIKVLKLSYYARSIVQCHFFTWNVFVTLEFCLYVFFIAAVVHYWSCVMFTYIVARENGLFDYYLVDGLLTAEQYTMIQLNLLGQILQRTLGLSFNMMEVIVGCAACCVGCYLLGANLAYVTSAAVLEQHQWRWYEATTKRYVLYMIKRKIALDLQERVVNYLKCQWDWKRCVGDVKFEGFPCEGTTSTWYHRYYKSLFQRYELFRFLNEDTLKHLAGRCIINFLPPGEVLLHSGEHGDVLHLLLQGYVEIIHNGSGFDSLGSTAEQSPILAILEVLGSKPVLFTLRAKTHVKLLSITLHDIWTAFSLTPHLTQDLSLALEDINLMEVLHKCAVSSNETPKASSYPSWHKIPKKRSHPRYQEWKYYYDRQRLLAWMRTILMRKTLMPDGKALRRWEFWRALIIWFYCIVDGLLYFFWGHYFALEMMLSFAIFLFLLVDMYLQLHVCYYNGDNILVVHPKSTALNYITSRFLLDFLGTYPTKLHLLIEHGLDSTSNLTYKSFIIFGCNKYLLLIRARQFWTLDFIRTPNDQAVKFGLFIFFTVTALMNFLTHLLMVTTSELLLVHEIFEKKLESSANSSFQFYLTTLKKVTFDFFFISCSTNYQTVNYINFMEVKFNYLNMILGYFLLVIAIMYFASIYYGFEDEHKETRANFLRYCKVFKVPWRVTKAFLAHFDQIAERPPSFDAITSGTLHSDLHLHMHPELSLINVSAFDSRTMRRLAVHLQEVYYRRGIIFYANEIIDTLYIVKQGEVQLLASEDSLIERLHVGSIFGNFDSCQMVRSMYTARCRGEVLLLAMKTSLFYELITREQVHVLREYCCSGNLGSIPSAVVPEDAIAPRKRKQVINLERPCLLYLYLALGMGSFCVTLTLLTMSYALLLDLILLGAGYVSDLLTFFKVKMSYAAFKKKMHLRVHKEVYCKKYSVMCDVASMVPFEVAGVFCWNYVWFRWLHFNRIIRVYWVVEHFTKKRHEVGLGILCFIILAVWAGVCLFWFALCIDKTCTKTYWLDDTDSMDNCATSAITCSIFLTVSLLTFRGQSFCPLHVSSTLFIIIYLLIVRILFVVFCAAVLNLLRKQRHLLLTYHKSIHRLCQAVSNATVSSSFQQRITVHTEKAWLMSGGHYSLGGTLESAPRSLIRKLKMSSFGHLIVHHPVFVGCHEDFMRQVIAYIEVRPFFEGDVVCHEGTMNGTMYFIHYGHVEVMKHETYEQVIDHLFGGDCFGIIQGLFTTAKHCYTFRSESVSQVCSLKLSDWCHLLDFFPATKYTIYENFKRNNVRFSTL